MKFAARSILATLILTASLAFAGVKSGTDKVTAIFPTKPDVTKNETFTGYISQLDNKVVFSLIDVPFTHTVSGDDAIEVAKALVVGDPIQMKEGMFKGTYHCLVITSIAPSGAVVYTMVIAADNHAIAVIVGIPDGVDEAAIKSTTKAFTDSITIKSAPKVSNN